MEFRLVSNSDPHIVECISGITDARDAMELVYACGDAGTDLLLIHSKALPQEFFQLSSGFAGEFVQKLVNYRLRTAAVFAPDGSYPARFREFLLEARRGPQFRAFDDHSKALEWLMATASQPRAS